MCGATGETRGSAAAANGEGHTRRSSGATGPCGLAAGRAASVELPALAYAWWRAPRGSVRGVDPPQCSTDGPLYRGWRLMSEKKCEKGGGK